MITNSKIAWGDQLGAQLITLAELMYIAEETEQQIVFWEELRNYRRGYQFLDVFDVSDVTLISRCGSLLKKIVSVYSHGGKKGSWQKQMKRIYQSRIHNIADSVVYRLVWLHYRDFDCKKGNENSLHASPEILKLSKQINYDLQDGFGTYQDWKKYESAIQKRLTFKQNIKAEAMQQYQNLSDGKETVAVHFRRTDYLVLASLNLGAEYYHEAMSHFDKDKVRFLVFSDDIEGCKTLELFNGIDAAFVSGNCPGVDMCLMSLCDNNIIANSTFSFWGAFLGSKKKKVVCPRDYAGEGGMYMNGNYYPESWIAI